MADIGDILKIIQGAAGGTAAGLGKYDELKDEEREERIAEEERKRRRQREDLSTALSVSDRLAPLFKAMGREDLGRMRTAESIPLKETEGGGLTRDTEAQARTITGNESIDALLQLVPEGVRGQSAEFARGLAAAEFDIEEQEFRQELDQKIEEIKTLEPIRAGIALEAELEKWRALEPLRMESWKRKAAINHMYRMQEMAASRLEGAPKPKDQFEALAAGVAQQLLDEGVTRQGRVDKEGEFVPIPVEEIPISQYRQLVLAQTIQKASEWGIRLPSQTEIAESINRMVRFWNPKLKSRMNPGLGAGLTPTQAALGVGGQGTTN